MAADSHTGNVDLPNYYLDCVYPMNSNVALRLCHFVIGPACCIFDTSLTEELNQAVSFWTRGGQTLMNAISLSSSGPCVVVCQLRSYTIVGPPVSLIINERKMAASSLSELL